MKSSMRRMAELVEFLFFFFFGSSETVDCRGVKSASGGCSDMNAYQVNGISGVD